MSNNGWKRKFDTSTIIANLIVLSLIIVGFIIIISIPIFVLNGATNILTNFNLIEISTFDSIPKNFFYFSFLLLLILFVGIVFELLSTLLIKLLKVQKTKKSIFVSYVMQLFLSIIFYKDVIEHIFTRIQVSWLGTTILFAFIYLSALMISDDYKDIKKL